MQKCGWQFAVVVALISCGSQAVAATPSTTVSLIQFDTTKMLTVKQNNSAKVIPEVDKSVQVQPQAIVESSLTLSSQIVEQIEESLKLSSRIVDMARLFPAGSATEKLLRSFRICADCKAYERFGERADGGYVTCMDGMDGNIQAAYSLGVAGHDQWSLDVHNRFAATVYQLDCTVKKPAQAGDGFVFHNKCIQSEDGHENSKFKDQSWSLPEMLAQTGQSSAADGSLLLKIDVEGAEWPVFEVASVNLLKKFRQIAVEFHSIAKENRHPQYLAAMTHILDAGFKVWHLHGNNFGSVYTHGNSVIPDVLEVTFVADDVAKLDTCKNDQEYTDKDAPNRGEREGPLVHIDERL